MFLSHTYHMSGRQVANPHKRKRTGHHQRLLPSSSKRQKTSEYRSGGGYIDTPAFWDSLSKICLTKYALREVDRRNGLVQQSPQKQQLHRPVTRGFLAEFKKSRTPAPSADQLLSGCATERRKDLQAFARHGGPDLSDIRGVRNRCSLYLIQANETVQCPEPYNSPEYAMSSTQSSSSRHRKRCSASTSQSKASVTNTTNTTVTKSTKRSLPKDSNYQLKLIDSGIYPYGYEFPDGHEPSLPAEWKEINQRLAHPRPSVSPSRFPENEYKEFVRADARAFNEDSVKDTVLPAMLRAMGASSGAQKNILFTNLEPMAEGLALAKPDYYYGAQPELIHGSVRDDLSKHIFPSAHAHLPAAPNFTLEAKGPSGSLAEALRQSCHNGAIGARAMHSLEAYGQEEPSYDNSAHTFSTIYHGGQLKMYAHSAAQPNGPDTRPEYYMHQINTYGMTGNKDTFIQGATAFKNAMDLTAEYRNTAIAHANEIGAQAVDGEDDENEETDDEDEDEDEDDAELGDEELAVAPAVIHRFALGSVREHDIYGEEEKSEEESQAEADAGNDDEDEDDEESETSVEDTYRRPPSKRSSSKSHKLSKSHRSSYHSSRRNRKTTSHQSSSTSLVKDQNGRRSWFGWRKP